ncbi:hypothetical protein SGLAM104S_10063 [Streptomyces glaucescens]
MSGTEVALIRLATTVLGAATKALLTPRPGAGLVPDPVRPLPRPAKPDRLAKVLAGRMNASYADLPEHERLAALTSVQDTFAAAGDLAAERLFALELDPGRLRAELSAPAAGLSERACELYEDLIGRCCEHLVEQLTAHPSFAARAAVEQVEGGGADAGAGGGRTGPGRPAPGRGGPGVRAAVRGVRGDGQQPDGPLRADARQVGGRVAAGDGLHQPLGQRWLRDDRPARSGSPGPDHGRGQQALGERDRLLLRGPAGSGKSTLVQWLALNAARQTFGGELADWNRCVPFVLRLRAFTAHESLPSPAEFLRAAGVPLHGAAPDGWTDRLLLEGRALVLVDGVDEVPDRLRKRTERWLKDLIAAYPLGQVRGDDPPRRYRRAGHRAPGRAAHAAGDEPGGRPLLPRPLAPAARSECRSDEERAELDTYENALRRAVGTRRDLGVLATNPLMCALLCALNRDRRMQLPRARKELYDAALDMLLVRRDSEREIVWGEGVDLTREEQTALLQRLAYWLIRNDLAEARQDEVVDLVADWMHAMSQVRGTPGQVFAHLLNRSGLLREPAPGAVGFVHRTFQDYLGAKAAVEARDFGVLVGHAHEDQWDDVVQMAVGHARLDERASLLTSLLRRADAEPEHGHRRSCWRRRAWPTHRSWILGYGRGWRRGRRGSCRRTATGASTNWPRWANSPWSCCRRWWRGSTEPHASAVVRTAAAVGGDAAYELVKQFRDDDRAWVANAVSTAWESFDAELYAQEMMAVRTGHRARPGEDRCPASATSRLHNVHLTGDHHDLSRVTSRAEVEQLFVSGNRRITDVAQLAAMERLRKIGLSNCPQIRSIAPLARPGLEWLSLAELHPSLDPSPLTDMPDLRHLGLGHPFLVENIGALPVCDQVTGLDLMSETRYMSLEGLERWTSLRWPCTARPICDSSTACRPCTDWRPCASSPYPTSICG